MKKGLNDAFRSHVGEHLRIPKIPLWFFGWVRPLSCGPRLRRVNDRFHKLAVSNQRGRFHTCANHRLFLVPCSWSSEEVKTSEEGQTRPWKPQVELKAPQFCSKPFSKGFTFEKRLCKCHFRNRILSFLLLPVALNHKLTFLPRKELELSAEGADRRAEDQVIKPLLSSSTFPRGGPRHDQ